LYFGEKKFTQPVHPKITKNVQKSNLKIGHQIIIFEQKILIFSENIDIPTTDPPFFEFSKNLYPFLSYSQKTKINF